MTYDAIILSPPSRGGVEDHTRRVLTNWRAMGLSAERWAGEGDLPASRALLIQYVPFLYARFGLSSLPARAARAGQRRGTRVGLFVHERWVPSTRLPWWMLSPLQRRQLMRLRRLVDVCLTPVPLWAPQLRAEVIPVGATLPVPRPFSPPEPDLPWLVFSPFAAGLRWSWIAESLQASDLIVAGADREALRTHHQTRRYYDARWEALGRLAAEAVVPTLARAGAVLLPFEDGLTTRRTSAMAALAAGAPVVSCRGPLFDALFEWSPVRLADTVSEFRDELVWVQQEPRSAEAAMRWFDTHLDGAKLDRSLAAALDL